jgi:hypothetical protein
MNNKQYLQELKWPWQKKKPRPQPVDTKLWALFHQIQASYCEALDYFVEKIMNETAKKEGVERDDLIFIWTGVNPRSRFYNPELKGEIPRLYKKYKPMWDKYFRQAEMNMVKKLPHIKNLWTQAIEEWENMPEGQAKQGHKDRIDRYKKHMKVNNNVIAKNVVSADSIIKGYGPAPDEQFEDSQTYSYCMFDYS